PRVGGERQLDHLGVDLAGFDGPLGHADGGDLGVGEDVGGDGGQPERLDGFAERVPDGDAALHGGDGGEHEHAGAVAGRVDAGRGRTRDLVDLDESVVVELDSGFFQADAAGVGDHADGHQGVGAFGGAAVFEGDHHAVGGAFDGGGAAAAHDVHAAAAVDLFEDFGAVGVFVGHHAVAAGDEGDLGAERAVGAGELGAGDAGADDDELFGELVEVVELPPGEDAFAVGFGAGEDARGGAGGHQHHVGPDGAVAHLDHLRVDQPA